MASRINEDGRPVCDGGRRGGVCTAEATHECLCASCAAQDAATDGFHACAAHLGDDLAERHRRVVEGREPRWSAIGARLDPAVARDLAGTPAAAPPCNAVCEARDGVPCEAGAAGHGGLHKGGARHPLGPVFWSDALDATDRAGLVAELTALRDAIGTLSRQGRDGGTAGRASIEAVRSLMPRWRAIAETLWGAAVPDWAATDPWPVVDRSRR
jgi:hypothetical protein